MSTPETIITQLQADITAANTTTGKTDTNIHDAVTSLIEGFGGNSGPFDIIYEGILDVPQSDEALSIVIDNLVTGNSRGHMYVTFFEFLGDIPTDTTVYTVYRNIVLNGSNQSGHFTTFFAGSSSCIKEGARLVSMYPSKGVIHLGSMDQTTLTINIPVDGTTYATCRGAWTIKCCRVCDEVM